MQNNANIISELGVLADEAYDDNNFIVQDTISKDTLQNTYTVLETQDTVFTTSGNNAGFQALLLKNNTTQDYIIAFRGTEFSLNSSNISETWKEAYAFYGVMKCLD